MGRKRKKKINFNSNKFWVSCLTLIIALLIFTFYSDENNLHISYYTENTVSNSIAFNTSKPRPIDTGGNNITMYFFDVGQADCILVSTGGHNMIIDAGNNADGKLITNYLKNDLGITHIDYLIGTHNHEDHIGGLDDIVKNFEIDNLYMPFVSVTSTKTYEDVENSALKKHLEIKNPNIGDTFPLGNAQISVMNVDNNEPTNKNESSIVLQLQFGNQTYLFTGDTEVVNENSRTWNDIDVLKVAHHGSTTSSSENFIDQVKPEIAIISVGPNNSYNLPKDTILKRLEKVGSTIYRTDDLGTILLTSDGNNNNVENIKDLCLDGNER